MSIENNECCMCTNMRQFNDKRYPNANFDMYFMSGNVHRILSSGPYIILIWNGDICCGSETEGHSEPKMYVVKNNSEFITVHNVIKTLINHDFYVPCQFNCLIDVVPLINPHKNDELGSAVVFEMAMASPGLPYKL